MSDHALFDVPDPLTDRFTLEQLPRLALWVAEQINMLGKTRIADAIMAGDPKAALPLAVWATPCIGSPPRLPRPSLPKLCSHPMTRATGSAFEVGRHPKHCQQLCQAQA